MYAYFGQSEDHVAPRGIQIVEFEDMTDFQPDYWRVKFSLLGPQPTDMWNDILEGIDDNSLSLVNPSPMTMVFQKYGLIIKLINHPTSNL